MITTETKELEISEKLKRKEDMIWNYKIMI